MSAQFPNGTIFAVSTALAQAVAISAISNAYPGVATTATPPSAGDILLIHSGWTDLNERIVRAADPSGNSFVLDGIDTGDLSRYGTGQGAGAYQHVTAWVNLSQVRETSKSGGDQQFYNWQYMEDKSGRQRQRPTYKNAKSIAITLDYDPALAWYSALSKADAAKDPVVLRAALPNGAQIFYYVYPSFDADPSLSMNENMTNAATFSLISDLTRYEAA